MATYTDEQLDAIVREVDSGKLYVTCGKHHYHGGKLPPKTSGCAQCWQAYYLWDYATTPPHLRQARLEELESIIHHAIEYEEKGKFGKDLELFEPTDPRFEVKIE